MRFGRKKDSSEESDAAEVAPEAAEVAEAPVGAWQESEPDIGTPDPATWALPADAAVAAGGDVAAAPATSGAPPGAAPAAAAAAGAPVLPVTEPQYASVPPGPPRAEPQPPRAGPQPPPAAAAPGGAASTVGDRPELLVAGAFAGAFLVAKILKRIGD